jgi:hypothetical protein
MEHNYTLVLSAATLFLAQGLARLEKNSKRKRKMDNVVARKREMLREAFPDETSGMMLEEDVRRLIEGDWSRDQAMTLIIDLAFSNPFAPYELDFKEEDFWSVLKEIGVVAQLHFPDVEEVRKTQREAFQVHRRIAWGKVALFGVGGLLILGTGGWFLAPIIGGAIGAAAGLSGAAATAHGLAVLGGGSLAIGGMGMAGGMWVVTGAGATLGLLGVGGVPLLLEIGAAAAKIELVKLQVNYKVVLLANQVHLAKAQQVIKSLDEQRDEIAQKLEQERELNEKNAQRIRDIEATLEALEDALKWMAKAGGNGGPTEREQPEAEREEAA